MSEFDRSEYTSQDTLQVPTELLTFGAQWALRAFGDDPRRTLAATPHLRHYVVPQRADIAGLAGYAPPSEPLSVDLVALVPVDDDGDLTDHARVEVTLAVVHTGETMPEYRAHHGPRLLGSHPYARNTWVYLLAADPLFGGATVHDDRMHMREDG